MNSCGDGRLMQAVQQAPYVWLFLDYDGTLSDFAATPDEIAPNEELIALIAELAARPDIRLTIISGRRLAHIQALLPEGEMMRAGTYGLELQTNSGEIVHRVARGSVRPFLDDLGQQWAQLLAGRQGFYLEDKGWALAVHAKDAAGDEAADVLEQAAAQAAALLDGANADILRLQGGHRFLECAPQAADKKRTVEYLLAAYPWQEQALLIYLGDDDKDEVAFQAVQGRGGLAIAVGDRLLNSTADCLLSSPQAARAWLRQLAEARG